MLIVEDAVGQLRPEYDPSVMDDYIVATYYVITNDITKLTNDYIQNCICLNEDVTCFDNKIPCNTVDASSGTYKSWNKEIEKNCADGQFDTQCVTANCENFHRADAFDCVAQGMPFFANPDGYNRKGSKLFLTNGQYQPTLEISADTWVRLRLGYMSTDFYLRVARHSNLQLDGHHTKITCAHTHSELADPARSPEPSLLCHSCLAARQS